MKKQILLIIIIILSTANAQIKNITLKESLEIGLKNSKELKISKSKVKSAKSSIREVGSQMLPKISFGANYSRLSEVDPFEITVPFYSEPIRIQESILNNYSLSLSLQQPLFTGFRLTSLKQASENFYESIKVDDLQKANEVAYDVHKAFWNFYKSQKQLKLVNENLTALSKHLEDTKNFLDEGVATKNDLLRIQVMYSNTELKKIEAENYVNVSRVLLNKALGIELNNETDIVAQLSEPDLSPYSYDELLFEALENRNEIQSINYVLKANENNITASKAGYLPSVYLSSNLYYSKPNQRIMPLEDEFNETWDVSVSLNWDLWDWGHTSSKVIQAEQSLVQTENQLNIIKENIETEVYRNYLTLISGFDKVKVSKSSVEASEENLRITNEKYLNQLATSRDLMDAEVDLLESKINLITSMIDFELARVNLEKSAGRKIY
ncbi:MAG: TolC family protein [Ignavibacteria bacterium]|jgi:outer membrane protein TolC